MVIFLLSFIVLVVLLSFVVWRLRQESPPGEESPLHPSVSRPESEETVSEGSTRKGPPSAGQGLEALRARLADMPSESLREMLEMGASLKPGAQELIEQELARRQGES